MACSDYDCSMKTVDTIEVSKLPSDQEISLARDSARLFRRTTNRRKGAVTIRFNNEELTLPESLMGVLSACLEIMAGGQSVAVVPVEQEIGTQEAADLLGVSRPFLVKLLEARGIPSRKVGVQRRVLLSDVLAYRQHEKDARRKVLMELAEEGQRLGLGE
jgi:excisionase family DNA binding protein